MSLFTFLFPELGMEMRNTGVVHWLVKPGDWVKMDQVMLEILTDKEVIEVPSPIAGIVTRICVPEGQRAYVGTELIVFTTKQPAFRTPNAQSALLSCPSSSRQRQNREHGILTVRKRGTNELPCAIERLEARDQMVTSSLSHRQRSYQLIWIKQGTGTHTIDFDEYPIQPNTLFFLEPNKVHSMQVTGPLSGIAIIFTRDALTFDANKALPLMLSCFHATDQKPYMHLTAKEAEHFAQTVTHIEQELHSTLPGRMEAVQAYLHILLTIVSRARKQSAETHLPQLTPLAQTFLTLVETQFHQKKQVSEYAELLAITPGHLNDLVKQNLGRTAGEIIRERVLLEAKRLLLYSEDSVAEIADHLDFDDPSYFSRFFRRYTRQSPNAFRTAMRQKRQASVALLA